MDIIIRRSLAMADNYETIVRWYLRFNGFFTVESFIVHEVVNQGNQQGGETDILGVRFPFSQENAGFQILNDTNLLGTGTRENGLTDIIIAEVKNRDDDYLNGIWKDPDPKYLERVAYIIRWIGIFKDENEIHRAASEIKSKYQFQEGNYRIRFIYFGKRKHQSIEQLGITQITFDEVIDFLLHLRMPSFYVHNSGARSPHHQWDTLIKDIWNVGDVRCNQSVEEQKKAIYRILDTK